jgi:hypothetical protein
MARIQVKLGIIKVKVDGFFLFHAFKLRIAEKT